MLKFMFITLIIQIFLQLVEVLANKPSIRDYYIMVKLKIKKFIKQFRLDFSLYIAEYIPFRPFLLFLGLLLFLYDFWFRYIRIRLPREIPYDLSLFVLIILVFIILIFIIRIISLLRYLLHYREQYPPYKKPPFKFLALKPLDPRFLQNLLKIFTPFSVLDYYIRNNKYLKKLELMYSFLPLILIVISGNYIWYSIKETKTNNYIEMNEKYLVEYIFTAESEDDRERYFTENKQYRLNVLGIGANDDAGSYTRLRSYDYKFNPDPALEPVYTNYEYKIHLWEDIKKKHMANYMIYLITYNYRENYTLWPAPDKNGLVYVVLEERDYLDYFQEEYSNWSWNDVQANQGYTFIFPEEQKRLEREFREDLLPYQLVLECLIFKHLSIEEYDKQYTPKRIIIILQISLSVLYMLGWLYVLIVSIPNMHITELELRIIEEMRKLIALENDEYIHV